MSAARAGKRGNRWWCLLLAIIIAPAVASAGEVGGMGSLLGDGISLDGGNMDFVKEKNAVVIRNYAILNVSNTRITARNMVYHNDTREVYAEGDVSFDEPGGSSFYCDRLFFDVGEWRGYAENVRIKAKSPTPLPVVSIQDESIKGPGDLRKSKIGKAGSISRMFVSAREVRSINKDHQELIDAVITPSAFVNPTIGIYSKAVNVRRDEKVESWHNVLKIGNIPVFYFPYIIKDLRYDWPWMRVGGGRSDKWGVTAKTKWGFDLFSSNKSAPFRIENIFFDLDYRSKRGMAYGSEVEYSVGKGESFGLLDVYYLNESGISKKDDLERGTDDNESVDYNDRRGWQPDLYRNDDRWGIDWQHRQVFNRNWDLRLEAHAYSDRDYRQEYDEIAYKEDKDAETSLDLRYLNDHLIAELVAVKRLNDFESRTEYLPELRITVPGYRLGVLPVYLENDIRVGFVNRRFDNILDHYSMLENEINKVTQGDNYGAFFRAYDQTVLRAPLHFGAFVLTPYVGFRATSYGDTYGRPARDSELTAAQIALRDAGIYDPSHVTESGRETDTALLWGFALNTKLYGLLNFGGQTYRHVIEPEIRYRADEDPSVDPERLFSIDDLESYHKQHVLTFALHQSLQRKDSEGVLNVLDFDVSFDQYPLKEEAEEYNYDRTVSQVNFDLIFRPNRKLTLAGNISLDNHDHEINRAFASADWRFNDMFRFYIHQQYYRGHYWGRQGENSDEINQTTLSLRTKLWNNDSRYHAEIAFTYDWEDNPSSFNGISEERLTLTRDCDVFELALSFVNDRKDDDKGVFVQLIPKGWMGFERPASASDLASRQAASRYGTTANASDENYELPRGNREADKPKYVPEE